MVDWQTLQTLFFVLSIISSILTWVFFFSVIKRLNHIESRMGVKDKSKRTYRDPSDWWKHGKSEGDEDED